MQNRKSIFLAFSLMCFLAGGLQAFSQSAGSSYGSNNQETKQYIQCLKEKEITMYGTSWCPHCKAQKREFGKFFNELNYVDCDRQAKVCRQKKITGYPTWLLPNGKEIDPGTIKEVAQASGCSLKPMIEEKVKQAVVEKEASTQVQPAAHSQENVESNSGAMAKPAANQNSDEVKNDSSQAMVKENMTNSSANTDK